LFSWRDKNEDIKYIFLVKFKIFKIYRDVFFFLCFFISFYFKTIIKLYFKSELVVDLFIFLLGLSRLSMDKKKRKLHQGSYNLVIFSLCQYYLGNYILVSKINNFIILYNSGSKENQQKNIRLFISLWLYSI